MAAPAELSRLVDRFRRSLPALRASGYNETQVRVEYIDPLFTLLGWDVHNTSGYAEQYKDVIHEDAIRVGGTTKAPDYCFRIGGVRKFFLEAKKPSVNIKEEPTAAFQLRRYAWSAKLPLSVLTDFEELATYDCRVKPEKTDKPSIARIQYLTFEEYPERWDEVAEVFSKEAVLKGSFDRFAGAAKGKRGTAEVDAAFLKEIERWRELLARNIALRNPDLTVRELNVAVQRTIDRIIFLRIAEDRGLESQHPLRAMQNGANVYPRLVDLFRAADERYNSGLFHFDKEKGFAEEPDRLTPNLAIDDKVLKDIIGNLYYPDSPYEFSVLPADILGQVYEQFLGKVIRLTAGHRAVVEDKPEVKKAGGVYYTPTYIVDYIVANTVGTLLEGKTPKQAAELKVLDPACGSGSFLLGAYQRLLDWHRDWYVADGPEKHAKADRNGSSALYLGPGNEWRLTTAERKRILLSSIFGVDIDHQAVEVTKLSLLLKVLEGETEESIGAQLKLFHERALPDLAGNIKCGNSLIGPDYFAGRQLDLFGEEEALRVNPFDWQKEFKDILSRENPGFDAVIGNPPYVRQEALKALKPYFQRRYEAYDAAADLFVYFIERGVNLLREKGRYSIIVSSSLLRAAFAEPLRSTIVRHAAVEAIVDFGGLAVFANAKDTYVCVPLLDKKQAPESLVVTMVPTLQFTSLESVVRDRSYSVPSKGLSPRGWTLQPEATSKVFEHLRASAVSLGQALDGRIFWGIKTGLNEAFELDAGEREALLAATPAAAPLVRRFLGGQQVRRYHVLEDGRYLIAIPSGWTGRQLAAAGLRVGDRGEKAAWTWLVDSMRGVADHLLPFAEALRKRQDQGEYWWELRSCDYYDVFDRPKILFPDIAKGPRFHLDDTCGWISNTAYMLDSDDPLLLGILNSRVGWFAISQISIPFGTRAGSFRYRLFTQYMEQLPIPAVVLSTETGKRQRDRGVGLVQHRIALQSRMSLLRTDHEGTALQRQIDATDREIDQLVYELYGLTDDEIRIVEDSTS